jgi:hypothetical protein
VLQQLFTINDPLLQRALTEPANLGYMKNVLGLTEMVIPGEDSRNKQLREIQLLLSSAPIVVNVPVPAQSASSVSLQPTNAVGAAATQASPAAPAGSHASMVGAGGASSNEAAEEGLHGPSSAEHTTHTLVLPSVPVDQLLDDHATEFEECKRWANSEAGQAAHMTNPAGFANVRAHAEAHLRAMSMAAAQMQPQQPQPGAKGKS